MKKTNKSSKKGIIGLIVGLTTGVAAAVAGGLATAKVVKEIKSDLNETVFVSPNETNKVTVERGSSKFARGMTYIKVTAKNGEKNCEMYFLFSGKEVDTISYDWRDENHFAMYVGDGLYREFGEVAFEDDKITMNHNTKQARID